VDSAPHALTTVEHLPEGQHVADDELGADVCDEPEQLEQVTGQHPFISWAQTVLLEVQYACDILQVYPAHPGLAARQLSLSEHAPAAIVGATVGLVAEVHRWPLPQPLI